MRSSFSDLFAFSTHLASAHRTSRLFAPAAALSAFFCLASSSPAAHAQTTALTLNSLIAANTSASATVRGWRFSIAAPLTVSALGWYDNGQDGLASSHQVGIFTTGGTLLVSATVQAGTVDPLTNFFRFNSSLTETSVGSATLAAGTYDVVGVSKNNDAIVRGLSSAQSPTALEVNFIQNVARNDATFAAPTSTQAGLDRGYFGANFQFTTNPAAVGPEPGSFALLGMGLVTGAGGLGMVRWRRKAGKANVA